MTFLPDAVRWYLTLVVATWALAPIARFVEKPNPETAAEYVSNHRRFIAEMAIDHPARSSRHLV